MTFGYTLTPAEQKEMTELLHDARQCVVKHPEIESTNVTLDKLASSVEKGFIPQGERWQIIELGVWLMQQPNNADGNYDALHNLIYKVDTGCAPIKPSDKQREEMEAMMKQYEQQNKSNQP